MKSDEYTECDEHSVCTCENGTSFKLDAALVKELEMAKQAMEP